MSPPPPKSTTSGDLHIAVLSFPFASHPASLLVLTRRLSAAVPNAYFSFFGTARSNKSLFPSGERIGEIRPFDVADGVPEGHVFGSRPEEGHELFMEAAPESFRRGIEAAEAETGRRVSCLVSDVFLWFAAEMAEELEVPWIPFRTAGATELCVNVYTDLIRDTIGFGGIAGREDETLDSIPSMSKFRIRDLAEGILVGDPNMIYSKIRHQMGVSLPRAAAVPINTFDELEPIFINDLKSKFNNLLTIGPLNFTLSSPAHNNNISNDNCLSWLDKQKYASVVYVSFGSVAMLPPNELSAVAEVLEASRVPFIWSLRDNLRMHLPEGFVDKTRESGMVVPWAPQKEILQHSSVGVFVSHGGWNSVLESIASEKPLICRPIFADQMINARIVEEVWEIGIGAEHGVLTKNGLVNSLEKILSQDDGKKMRARISEYKEQGIKAIGENGSSTKNFIKLVELISSNQA